MEVIIIFGFLAWLASSTFRAYRKGIEASQKADWEELNARRQAEIAERSVAKAMDLVAEKMKARDSEQAFEARVNDEVLRRVASLQQAQAQANADAEARIKAMQKSLDQVTAAAMEQALAQFNGKVAEAKAPVAEATGAEAKPLQPWAEAKAKAQAQAQAQASVPPADTDADEAEAEAEAEANAMIRNRYQAARDGDEPVQEEEGVGQQLEPASYDADQDFPSPHAM